MFNKYVLTPIIQCFEKYKERYSFCIEEKFYTYFELAQHISKIRVALKSEKIENRNIGLVANDDIETYASILALWLEGLAYIPIHPFQPRERNLEVIYQADIQLIIDSEQRNIAPGIKSINSRDLKYIEMFLSPVPIEDINLAYILFTSGSTGKPKGVKITRENVGAFMKAFNASGIEISEIDRCLQCFDLTFDVSVQSFLFPLIYGACIYTIPHDQIKYSYAYGLLEDHELTFGAMAPSMVRYLRPYFDEINLPALRYNILTAEASPLDLVQEWSKCIPNAEIFDFYGPTEATIYCTYYKYQKAELNKSVNGMLSIGTPMEGVEAIIIDENHTKVGANVKGELCVGGKQITTGYWKNDEKNTDSFFYLQENDVKVRFYKTGDCCYFDHDGDIMLIGRFDHQVKIQGFRIELGEIEFHAREFLRGQNVVAIAGENSIGVMEIVLFVEGDLEAEKRLMDYLSSKMPYYMIPARIVALKNFPINSNGKIDRIKISEYK